MKQRLLIRFLAAGLASLMLWGAVACDVAGNVNNTQNPNITTPNEDATDPESIPPSDIPKDATYVTTTDLVLPEYTYGITDATDLNNGILPSNRDVFADTWTATDDVGRSMPENAKEVDDSLIGMFYFLWRDADQETLNPIGATDHYKAYLEGGIDKLWEEMQVGGEGHPHYWAEPYFGYYSSNDEWVLRKHAYMFAEAGIDFLFFDTTNNNIHERTVMALFKVWEEVKQEG